MKKIILSIAIAAFSMTTLSVLTAQEAQAKKVYRPNKHSKKYVTKKHTRRNKGKYQGGNSVPNPPLASVQIYQAPIEHTKFENNPNPHVAQPTSTRSSTHIHT